MNQPQTSPPSKPAFSVSRGKKAEAIRLFVYTVPGLGKTTLLAESDKALIADVENGSHHVDVARIEHGYINTWEKVIAFADALLQTTDFDEYKTIGFDTLNALERMLHAYLIRRDAPESREGNSIVKGSIEAYGFKKGFTIAAEEFRKLLARLERLRVTKGKNIVFTSHSMTVKVPNPLGQDYEKYVPSVNDKLWAELFGWCDVVGFGQHQVVTIQTSKRAKAKVDAKRSGARTLHVQPSASWEAKTRYMMPPEMSFSAETFWTNLQRGMINTADKLRKEIEEILANIKETTLMTDRTGQVVPVTQAVRNAMAQVGDDTGKLARIRDGALGKLREQTQDEGEETAGETTSGEEAGAAQAIPDGDSEPPPDVVTVNLNQASNAGAGTPPTA